MGIAVASCPSATLSLRLLELRIVLSALFGHAEGMVGFADGNEPRGCIGVLAIVIGVVLLRQSVELALDLGRSGGWSQFQCFIVVR